jgi:hypothetical protein
MQTYLSQNIPQRIATGSTTRLNGDASLSLSVPVLADQDRKGLWCFSLLLSAAIIRWAEKERAINARAREERRGKGQARRTHFQLD